MITNAVIALFVVALIEAVTIGGIFIYQLVTYKEA